MNLRSLIPQKAAKPTPCQGTLGFIKHCLQQVEGEGGGSQDAAASDMHTPIGLLSFQSLRSLHSTRIYRGRFLSSVLLLVKARLYNVPKGYYIETSPNYDCTRTELIPRVSINPAMLITSNELTLPYTSKGTFPSKAHFIPLEACAPLTKLLAKFFQPCRISCQCCCLRSRKALLD